MSENLRLLLIDDDPDMRALVRILLARELPRAELVEVDPIVEELPSTQADIAQYDCVLLDYNLGPVGNGLDWLRMQRHLVSDGPPVILLTGADDAYVAARAVKMGAEDYLNKRDLTARRLAEVITAATTSRERMASASDTAQTLPAPLTAGLAAPSGQPPEISGYALGRMIGKGSTAEVFLAERLSDGMTVVLKLLKAHMLEASEDRIERFIREAELVSSLHSPQVVRIYEQAFTDEVGLIAMEYLPGGDLRERIAAGLTPSTALRYIRELLLGLEAIHGVGVVHRDLKPANVMFRTDGSLAIADFGLSRRIDASTDLTMSGQIMGTPAYMSPEQGQGDVATERSDLYSAGVMFYEMLSGAKPFVAASLTAVIYKHITAPIPRLPVPVARFQPIVDALMAKEPGDRPPYASDAIELCDRVCATDV